MNDPWRFIAFPVSAVAGYLVSLGASSQFSSLTGMTPLASEVVLVAIVGFIAGFIVDEMIPTYLDSVKNRSGDGADFGGDLNDGDLDFD